MDLTHFQELFKNEPRYRLGQAKKAIFQELIENWQEATVMPLTLREKLNEKCPILIFAKIFSSKDEKTIKALITLKDGLEIETVLMRHQDKRNTVCVSSQVGCPLACLFCATGKMGFKRNLEEFEIIEQVLFFSRYLKKEKEKVTNIVFMGMGEPFLNYENVMGAIKVLNDKGGLNLGARHFSISTAGITEGIEKLAKENLQVNLAISLHTPNEELRLELMPISEKYPIKKILIAVDDYIEKTRRRVMFEYIMIKDVNDSDEQAAELAELMLKPLYFVNIIPCNPNGDIKPSTKIRISRFKEILEERGVGVIQRYSFGRDIEGACGQLATKETLLSD
ncbi:MAG: 23S rRNA (adenine(2503)-C(2))-methyltransferase RlmN [bacterium]|nr:23S rRNA (adenine(2503)-C(2))-methyltransferase RlmN [bacterium]